MSLSTWSVILAFFALIPLGCSLSSREDRAIKQIRELIDKEIPVGSTKVEVIAFLDSRRIEHSDYDKSKDENRNIYAAIRSVYKDSSNTSYGVFLVMSFDKDNRLISYSTKVEGNSS